MNNRNEISALISLLDDKDEIVFDMISNHIMLQGSEIISVLEHEWEQSSNPIIQNRLELMIENLQFNNTRQSFVNWLNVGGDNLLKGAFVISTFQYPDHKYEDVEALIHEIVTEVQQNITDTLESKEIISEINKVFFEKYNFRLNPRYLYSPFSSSMMRVLESQNGNAISLGIIYITIAQKLGLSVRGVILPHNFVLACTDNLPDGNNGVAFYIDIISRGAIISKNDIENYLERYGVEPKQEYFEPSSNIKIIENLMGFLMICYNHQEQNIKVEKLRELLSLSRGMAKEQKK